MCASLSQVNLHFMTLSFHKRETKLAGDKHIYTLIVNKQLEQSKEHKFQNEKADLSPDSNTVQVIFIL